MYIQVRLLNGFKEPLLYTVPPHWNCDLKPGTLVTVPLRTKNYLALTQRTFKEKPITSFALKQVLRVEQFPEDIHYFGFITQLAHYYQTEPIHFVKRIKNFLLEAEPTSILTLPNEPLEYKTPVQLTQEQQTVIDFMYNCLDTFNYNPTLLHGVTGSGKTEIYKKLIEKTIQSQKTVILLLPEVTLALQFFYTLKNQLPSDIILVNFHSGTPAKEKKMVWSLLLQGAPCVIIGVHLPLLLPIKNLGLIIVDEEHETGYQEKKHPKINSKEAALLRAQLLKIPILLGSATPSISSLYNVKHKKWNFFQLKKDLKGFFLQ